jgi:hypothetical protein
MNWQYNEVVRAGNATAKIKNFYPDTGLVVLYFIEGEFKPGMTIVGDESGETLTLDAFNITFDYDMGYEPDYWETVLVDAIYDGLGNLVALDKHFTGKPSQDYQVTYLVVEK